jgi:hypothetical protein
VLSINRITGKDRQADDIVVYISAIGPTARASKGIFMRPVRLASLTALSISLATSSGLAQHNSSSGPYKVLKKAKVGGDGFDYISADVEGRRLYLPRNGPMGQLTVCL